MAKDGKSDSPCSPEAIQKVTEHIQEKVDSGWTMPCGWLFKSLTLFFPESENDSASEGPKPKQSQRIHLAQNTAKFAGASVTTSLKDLSITHVVVDPDIASSEITKLRKTLSTRRKLPHIVKVDWIEASWKEKTLVDEERKRPRFVS
jgi:DNA ligase-4